MAAPAVRKLSDILKSLDSTYAPQSKLVQEQIASLTPYYAAQQQGLEATQKQSFADIANQAQSRGVLYSGVPIAEQSQYTAQKFLPAMAGLKQEESQGRLSLMQSLQKIAEQKRLQAEDIRQQELTRRSDYSIASAKLAQQKWEFQQRMALEQFKAQAAAARAAARGTSQKAPTAAQLKQRFNSEMVNLFKGYDPRARSYYTENVVIPKLVSKYQLSPKQVADSVYAYRQLRFGEGPGWY